MENGDTFFFTFHSQNLIHSEIDQVRLLNSSWLVEHTLKWNVKSCQINSKNSFLRTTWGNTEMRSGEWCRGDQNYTRTPNFIQIGLTNHSVQYEEVISIIEIMTPTKIFKHHVVFKVLCKSFGFESGYLHVESFFFFKEYWSL